MKDREVAMILVEHQDRVAIVKLQRGVTNPLDRRLVDQLGGTLQEVAGDPAVRGVVLGSASDKFFSIGFDIPQLLELTRPEFATYYRAFNRVCLDLFTLPKPTVAAITGHAIAGGCILALCCDYRLIADGRRLMGLNEIKLGVPVPYVAHRILRDLVGGRQARQIVESGDFYRPEESLSLGLVDQVCPPDQVLSRAVDRASLLGSSSPEAFAVIKRNRVERLEAEILARLADKEQLFVECWYSEEARRRLREAMDKF
jgi:enoyl-CoA hydratase/carnithine racemase